MSAPAANAFSLPVITIAPMHRRRRMPERLAELLHELGLSALSCFGRLSVMRPTRPFCSTEMNWYVIGWRP